MNKKQTYITDGEREKCQKVVDAFSELFENEDLTVINAGKYGFIKLQYLMTAGSCSMTFGKNGLTCSFPILRETRQWKKRTAGIY